MHTNITRPFTFPNLISLPNPLFPGTGPVVKNIAQPKGIDLESQGNINGVPVYEVDLCTLQDDEKPWHKPGADITDYFNYGFNLIPAKT